MNSAIMIEEIKHFGRIKSPTQFYYVRKSDADEDYEKMLKAMKRSYQKHRPSTPLSGLNSGQLVAVFCSPNDWKRGKIIRCQGSRVHVFFVDSAEVDEAIERSSIFKLGDYWQVHPPTHYRVFEIEGLLPQNQKDWNMSALVKIHSLVHNAKRSFAVVAKRISNHRVVGDIVMEMPSSNLENLGFEIQSNFVSLKKLLLKTKEAINRHEESFYSDCSENLAPANVENDKIQVKSQKTEINRVQNSLLAPSKIAHLRENIKLHKDLKENAPDKVKLETSLPSISRTDNQSDKDVQIFALDDSLEPKEKSSDLRNLIDDRWKQKFGHERSFSTNSSQLQKSENYKSESKILSLDESLEPKEKSNDLRNLIDRRWKHKFGSSQNSQFQNESRIENDSNELLAKKQVKISDHVEAISPIEISTIGSENDEMPSLAVVHEISNFQANNPTKLEWWETDECVNLVLSFHGLVEGQEDLCDSNFYLCITPKKFTMHYLSSLPQLISMDNYVLSHEIIPTKTQFSLKGLSVRITLEKAQNKVWNCLTPFLNEDGKTLKAPWIHVDPIKITDNHPKEKSDEEMTDWGYSSAPKDIDDGIASWGSQSSGLNNSSEDSGDEMDDICMTPNAPLVVTPRQNW